MNFELTLQQWFDAYGDSHRNALNKKIHFVCVPAITLTVIAMAHLISPTLCVALMLAATVFYARLSVPLSMGMAGFFALSFLLMQVTNFGWGSWIGLFVLAWIGQFYGHKVEGKKPSFFEDLQFLLIGPLWVLGFLYEKKGIAFGATTALTPAQAPVESAEG